jgi:hypothetical protein
MDGLVAEVETAGGLTGHGFSLITNDEVVVSAIRDVIAPYLKGKDAFARRGGATCWKTTPSIFCNSTSAWREGFTAGMKIAGMAQAFGVPIDNAGAY